MLEHHLPGSMTTFPGTKAFAFPKQYMPNSFPYLSNLVQVRRRPLLAVVKCPCLHGYLTVVLECPHKDWKRFCNSIWSLYLCNKFVLLGIIKHVQLRPSGYRCLLPSLEAWTWSSELTVWKEREDSLIVVLWPHVCYNKHMGEKRQTDRHTHILNQSIS